MRTLPLALGALVLLLAVPAAAACGGEGEGEGERYCHDYTIHAGEDDGAAGLHANAEGQFLLSVAGTFYLEQDVAYLDNDEGALFSIWFYEEANGRPGLQRADESCNNTPEGEHSDVIWC